MYTFNLTKNGQVIEHQEGLSLKEVGDLAMQRFYYQDRGTEWERFFRVVLSRLQVSQVNWDESHDTGRKFTITRTQ